MNLLDFKTDFNYEVYNNLKSVEDADQALKDNLDLNDFFKDASTLFWKYGLQSRLGVALLHKHRPCLEDERMIEYPEILDGIDALVTRPSKSDSKVSDMVPTLWQILDEKYHPLEYSHDQEANNLIRAQEISPNFLKEFKLLSNKYHTSQLIGLAIVKRELYKSAKPDEIAIEYSDLKDSIVILKKQVEVKGQTIDTAWDFEKTFDPVLGCLRGCKRQCYSKDGGHDKDHVAHHHPNAPDSLIEIPSRN